MSSFDLFLRDLKTVGWKLEAAFWKIMCALMVDYNLLFRRVRNPVEWFRNFFPQRVHVLKLMLSPRFKPFQAVLSKAEYTVVVRHVTHSCTEIARYFWIDDVYSYDPSPQTAGKLGALVGEIFVQNLPYLLREFFSSDTDPQYFDRSILLPIELLAREPGLRLEVMADFGVPLVERELWEMDAG